MRIRVSGIEGISDLASDLAAAPASWRSQGSRAVRASIDEGAEDAERIAQSMAGPHGANYYKRIDAEMLGLLEGEYGPSPVIGERFTGVSGSAGAMRDLDKSAPRAARRLQRRAALIADKGLW
jgi:hypothetical protein